MEAQKDDISTYEENINAGENEKISCLKVI